MDTTNDPAEVPIKKTEKKDSMYSDDAAKKSKPLLPKSAVCRILSELVRSYPACAKLVSDYGYRAKQTELIPEVSSRSFFVAMNFQFIYDNDVYRNAQLWPSFWIIFCLNAKTPVTRIAPPWPGCFWPPLLHQTTVPKLKLIWLER